MAGIVCAVGSVGHVEPRQLGDLAAFSHERNGGSLVLAPVGDRGIRFGSMEPVVCYDFNDLFRPHGEDNPTYRYEAGDLFLDVPYELNTQWIRLRFGFCAYLYHYPIPGQVPDGLELPFRFSAGILYELDNSPLVEAALECYSDNTRPEFRHYFLHLEWTNDIFQMIATSVELLEPGIRPTS